MKKSEKVSKKAKSFMMPYNAVPYGFSVFSFLIVLCFLIVFFVITAQLPDIVPTHWSADAGIDGWGAKTELYPVGIIPMAFAVAALPLSVVLIRKDYRGFSYFVNGCSVFATVMCMLAATVLLKGALA